MCVCVYAHLQCTDLQASVCVAMLESGKGVSKELPGENGKEEVEVGGRRSRSAIKRVGGKSAQMRGKAKKGEGGGGDDSLVAKVRGERKTQRNERNKRQRCVSLVKPLQYG